MISCLLSGFLTSYIVFLLALSPLKIHYMDHLAMLKATKLVLYSLQDFQKLSAALAHWDGA
jgi:hypothetical protein